VYRLDDGDRLSWKGRMIGGMEVGWAGTITFLFTDLEGSTRLWEQFPDGMKDALKRHDAILRGAIESSGGLVRRGTGSILSDVSGGSVGGSGLACVERNTAQHRPGGLCPPARSRRSDAPKLPSG
jgi:class 3 adenylate cyclase